MSDTATTIISIELLIFLLVIAFCLGCTYGRNHPLTDEYDDDPEDGGPGETNVIYLEDYRRKAA